MPSENKKGCGYQVPTDTNLYEEIMRHMPDWVLSFIKACIYTSQQDFMRRMPDCILSVG